MRVFVGALCAVVVGFGVTPAAAAASILFDNGSALPGAGGSDLSLWRAADDFVLGVKAQVTGGTFTYATSGAFLEPENVRYFVYDKSGGGTGNDPPGTLLASGLLSITDAYFIDDRGGLNLISHYVAEFQLAAPFLAQAGQRYWFALNSQSAPDAQNDPQISWVASDFFSDTRTWEQSRFDDPPYSVWRSVDYERAFTLTGAAVPEPSAWTLIIFGFGCVGSWLRRRRSALAAAR